jgi:hypothetical protein
VFPVRYGRTYRVELSFKGRAMDNTQKCDSYISIPSSQTHRSYSHDIHDKIHLNSTGRLHLGFPRDTITRVLCIDVFLP